MCGEIGKGMTLKSGTFVGVFLCTFLTTFLMVKGDVFSSDSPMYEEVIEHEEIDDEDSRAVLRAFYTSPPVVPHKVESENSKDCLECHLNVTKLEDGRIGPKTPHPQFTSCLQCHVPGQKMPNIQFISQWKRLDEPKRGDRWFTTSPPTVPHRIKLRENCLSCHGPENPNMELRTPHPERTSCLQCHVPNYNNQFEIKH